MSLSIFSKHSLLVVVSLTAFVLASNVACAQLFSPLGPTSKYACIKFPSGKFGVGLATKTGYDSKEFGSVSRDLGKKLSSARDSLKGKKRVYNEFIKDQELTKAEVSSVLAGATNTGVPSGVAQRLLKLNEGVKKVNDTIVKLTAELRALENCKKGKTDFNLNFSSSTAKFLTRNAQAIILTIGIELPYAGTYPTDFSVPFCRRKEGNTGKYSFSRAVKNPCGPQTTNGVFDACLAPKDLLFIPLSITQLSATASDALINSALSDLERDYGGIYSIKTIGDNPNDPCGYITE
jgi:hypothetical protein